MCKCTTMYQTVLLLNFHEAYVIRRKGWGSNDSDLFLLRKEGLHEITLNLANVC